MLSKSRPDVAPAPPISGRRTHQSAAAGSALGRATTAVYLAGSLLTVFIAVMWVLFYRDRIVAVEGALVLASVLVAYVRPEAGGKWFRAFDAVLGRIARKPARAVVLVGLLAFAARTALLPIFPAPSPRINDEFSNLLAGATFASGKLTNPTPPLWMHFESFQIDLRPTYMSMYPPAQGLLLALGTILAGQAWVGLWISSALMCAGVCWALQGWLSPRWALFGGLLVTLRIGILSYFANSYWGAAPAALGGALVIGAFPRIQRSCRARDSIAMGIGLALLANSRPYEGFVLGAVVVAALAIWAAGKNAPRPRILMWRVALPLGAVLALAGGCMVYYNARVFGSPWLMPYQVNRATYAVAPVFPWLPVATAPHYNHKAMQDFYLGWELDEYRKAQSVSGRFEQTGWKAITFWEFYVGPALTIPFLMVAQICSDRRYRLLCIAGAALAAALLVGVFFNPHYAAPGTALIFILLIQGMRRLQLWRRNGRKTGLFLVRSILPICLAVLFVVACAPAPLSQTWPDYGWYYFVPSETPRDRITQRLEAIPGSHLVIVRYAPHHHPFHEWVYNEPDIDSARVVWAREMSADRNERLIRYFRGKRVWLLEPDSEPPMLSPYPVRQALPDQPGTQ